MSIELNKTDKKAARILIEKGLQKEMTTHLRQQLTILSKWEANGSNAKETYYQACKTLADFEGHIARRYDGLRGSRFLLVILEQYREGVLSDADLQELSPATQEVVKRFTSMKKGVLSVKH